MSSTFANLCRLVIEPLEVDLAVATPVGEIVVCRRVVRGCLMSVEGRVLPANLVVFAMKGFDVILGIDWFTKHYASIYCAQKQMTFKPPRSEEVNLVGSQVRSLPPILSAVQGKKLVMNGDQASLAFIVEQQKEKKDLQGIPVVQDFSDVFSAEFSRLRLELNVEFGIEYISGTTTVSKALYMMHRQS